MIDYTSLKLSGAGIKLKADLENDVKSIITKISDKRMDYITEIVKAANAEKTGVEISFNGISDLEFPEREDFMTLLACVRSCDETGVFKKSGDGDDIAEIDGYDLAEDIEKMVRDLNKLKDDYLIVFEKEPSLYRVFHTDGEDFYDRDFTFYEKQASRIEAQLKTERDELIYEQLKMIEGIDSDKKRERCEGNIKTQKEIIADLESELEAVRDFGEMRIKIIKTQRDLRWEKAKDEPDNKKIKAYMKALEKLYAEKSKEKYTGYLWSYNNNSEELSETAEGNEKAMKKLPEPESEVLPYIKEILKKQKEFDVLAVAVTRLEESIKKWQNNEVMKSAKKEETEQAVESNFSEAEKAIREAIKILGEKNENLLLQYHEAVKTGNAMVQSTFEAVGAGKESPKLQGAEEIQKLSEQLSFKIPDEELPAIEQAASENPEAETIYIDEPENEAAVQKIVPSIAADMQRLFDDENRKKILRNLLKAAQKEYNKKDSEEYTRSYLEKGREIRENIGG